jgi:hypothetical protein
MRRESKCPPGRAWIQTVLHTNFGAKALTNFLESNMPVDVLTLQKADTEEREKEDWEGGGSGGGA